MEATLFDDSKNMYLCIIKLHASHYVTKRIKTLVRRVLK